MPIKVHDKRFGVIAVEKRFVATSFEFDFLH